ncbi:hypothetical protein LSTR_LSTR001478 [Laodelphax striatellus]|uniref:Uncharacterized protein n=1 Tax=Laodelphax striatellus TaxID=195883 RepID=A0A482XAE5_LAOST|nr:hypothetical protein LSTR_LSTR001478 [Laodelphax striatellus]
MHPDVLCETVEVQEITSEESDCVVVNVEDVGMVEQNNDNIINCEMFVGQAAPASSEKKIPKLKHTISPLLRVESKRNKAEDNLAGKRLDALADEKLGLVELQKQVYTQQLQHAQQEHNLKLQLMKEKHQIEMELLLLDKEAKELDIRLKKTSTSNVNIFHF